MFWARCTRAGCACRMWLAASVPSVPACLPAHVLALPCLACLQLLKPKKTEITDKLRQEINKVRWGGVWGDPTWVGCRLVAPGWFVGC